jgi:hypothetical protein
MGPGRQSSCVGMREHLPEIFHRERYVGCKGPMAGSVCPLPPPSRPEVRISPPTSPEPPGPVPAVAGHFVHGTAEKDHQATPWFPTTLSQSLLHDFLPSATFQKKGTNADACLGSHWPQGNLKTPRHHTCVHTHRCYLSLSHTPRHTDTQSPHTDRHAHGLKLSFISKLFPMVWINRPSGD